MKMNEIVSFLVKRKLGERGCFAEIFLNVSVVDSTKQGVDWEFRCDVGEFKSAIVFGIDYFYENFLRLGGNGKLKITIVKFSAIPVDTTFINTAYVTVGALAKALNVSINGLTIYEQAGSFVFPMF